MGSNLAIRACTRQSHAQGRTAAPSAVTLSAKYDRSTLDTETERAVASVYISVSLREYSSSTHFTVSTRAHYH